MRKAYQFIIALFLIPIFVLALLNIVWPDQDESVEENRVLAQWPAFSVDSLFSGQYAMDIEAFFSDQFPFRRFLIDTHQQAVSLLQAPLQGDLSIVIRPGDDIGEGERLEPNPDDYIAETTNQPTETSGPVHTPSPSPSVSHDPSETIMPTESSEPDPTPVPTTIRPTEPEVTIEPVEGKVTNYSAVIVLNDRAMELYYFNQERVSRYIDLFARLQNKLPDTRIFDLVAPTSVEFYAPEKYHINSSSQKNAIAYIYDHLPDSIVTVDAYGKIVRHYQDYIYFRTDHHWTARGAYHAYEAFCESAGLQAVPIDSMESGVIDGGFVGSLYRYTKSAVLKNNPDHVEYFMPVVDSQGIAYSSAAMTDGYKIRAVYPQIGSTNKYLAFIGGDHPIAHFKTSLENGRSIVVLKESFGNALVPYLTNHYENVYVLDPRSIDISLPDFVNEYAINDVLIINYTFSLTNSKWVNGFEAMIG